MTVKSINVLLYCSQYVTQNILKLTFIMCNGKLIFTVYRLLASDVLTNGTKTEDIKYQTTY